jgi:hypothetical protein
MPKTKVVEKEEKVIKKESKIVFTPSSDMQEILDANKKLAEGSE